MYLLEKPLENAHKKVITDSMLKKTIKTATTTLILFDELKQYFNSPTTYVLTVVNPTEWIE